MFEILLYIITGVVVYFTWLELKRNNFDVFQIIFPFLITYWYIYVFKFFRIEAILFENFPGDLILEGLIKALLGIVVFYLGYRSLVAQRLAARLPKAPEDWSPGALFPYAVFLFAIALLGEFIFIQNSGGTAIFFSKARGAGDYQQNTAYLYSLKWLSIPASIIILVEIYMNKMVGVRKYLGLALVVCAAAYQLAMGQRSGVLTFGIVLGAIFYYENPLRTSNYLKILGISIVCYLAIGYLGLCRDEFYLGSNFARTQVLFDQDATKSIYRISNNFLWTGTIPNRDIRSFLYQEPAIYLRVIDVAPRVVGFNYGDHYLNYFVRWIPRIFWPNRPNFGTEYHRKLERAMGLNLSGPTLTILGYYQANFGYIGIIIGMFLSGICFSVIYRWFRKHSDKKGALILYSHFLVYGIISVFSYGILTGWSYYIPFYLLPAGLSYWYLHFIQKRKASTPISIGIAQIRYYQRSIKRNVPLKFQKRPDDP